MIDPARSFDRAAIEYEAARPGYPDALLDELPLADASTVLDLGAGTGKLTRVLVRRYARVFAVEPLEGMRAILEQVVPEAESRAGRAEEIPLEDASLDAVLAGQAFHWFANDTAVAEIARVLRPGGVVALIWNRGDPHPSPLPGAYNEYMESLQAPTAQVLDGLPTVEELLARGPFGRVREAATVHRQQQARDGVLAFARSVSWVAQRPAAEQDAIMRRLDALLPAGPFTFTMTAEMAWAVRA